MSEKHVTFSFDDASLVSLDDMRARGHFAPPRPHVVVLCGRTAHREAYRACNAAETLAGHIVLSCGVFKGDPEWGEPSKVALDELHLRKIDLADEVIIIEPDDVGASTLREIAYARTAGKPIREYRHGGER